MAAIFLKKLCDLFVYRKLLKRITDHQFVDLVSLSSLLSTAETLCDRSTTMTTSTEIIEAAAARKCLGADCSKDAGSLQCPTCLKDGTESYFCSQECFKRNWVCLVLDMSAVQPETDRKTRF